MLRLDLGSGPNPREGYVGVDKCDGAEVRIDLIYDLWPWPNESVDMLYSSHFIEHIPIASNKVGQDFLLQFFDDCYRIAKPAALFELRWPAPQHVWAIQDPTHRRFIPPETLSYLSLSGRRILGVERYCRCNWEIVEIMSRCLTGQESTGIPCEYQALLRRA